MRLASIVLFGLTALPAFAGLLYDPAAGQLPNAYTPNPWSYAQMTSSFAVAFAPTSPISASVAGGKLTFDTTGGTVRGGWSTTGGVMDRTTGYTLSFDLQIGTKSHGSNDRAGFSVIALSSDLQGIELGFWGNEAWAQNSGFTHGEGTTGFNPSGAFVSYDLTIQGSSYTLKANDSTILTGALRTYSGDPYGTANFIFFGDNTFSAQADVDLGAVNYAPVPEPAGWSALAAAGLVGFAVWRRRNQPV
jgi:hypothetical protein